MTDIGNYLESVKRAKIIDQNSDYIHCVYTTKWLRFKDDVEDTMTEEINLFI